MLACMTGGAAILFALTGLTMLAMLPISLGAFSAVVGRPGRRSTAVWRLGVLGLSLGLLELGLGVAFLPVGVLGIVQLVLAASTLRLNERKRPS